MRNSHILDPKSEMELLLPPFPPFESGELHEAHEASPCALFPKPFVLRSFVVTPALEVEGDAQCGLV